MRSAPEPSTSIGHARRRTANSNTAIARSSIAATVSSIAANGLMPQVRLVRVRVEQRLLLAVVLELELDHPAVAVGRRVDECRFLVEAVIDRDDFARQRRIQLGD